MECWSLLPLLDAERLLKRSKLLVEKRRQAAALHTLERPCPESCAPALRRDAFSRAKRDKPHDLPMKPPSRFSKHRKTTPRGKPRTKECYHGFHGLRILFPRRLRDGAHLDTTTIRASSPRPSPPQVCGGEGGDAARGRKARGGSCKMRPSGWQLQQKQTKATKNPDSESELCSLRSLLFKKSV
jgi:hypothetical protein